MPAATLFPAIEKKPFSVQDISSESACILPYEVITGLETYVNQRTLSVRRTAFIRAIVENNFNAAIMYMPDYMTRKQLVELNWLLSRMPSDCWGSHQTVQAYLRGQS